MNPDTQTNWMNYTKPDYLPYNVSFIPDNQRFLAGDYAQVRNEFGLNNPKTLDFAKVINAAPANTANTNPTSTGNPSIWEKIVDFGKSLFAPVEGSNPDNQNSFANSRLGYGFQTLNAGASLFDTYNRWRANREAMKNMQLQREAAKYNLERTKSENQRLDRLRNNVNSSYTTNAYY